MQKLSNDNQTAGTMGAAISITVNIIKKRIAAPSSSDQTIQVHAAALDSIPTTEPVSNQLPSPRHAIGTQHDPHFATAVSSAKQQGSRVRIEGLLMRPEINGRTGVICSAFNEENGRWTVLLDSSSSDAPCHVSIRDANLIAMHDTLITKATSSAASALPSAAKAVELPFPAMNPVTVPISPPVTHPAQLSVALKEGLHVRIEGLQSKPEMNGRTGVIRGAFNQESARWTVQIDADGTNISCQGHFRPINLKVIPAHDFSSEWLDEDGRVCPKNVDFSSQCPKGHSLAAFTHCGGNCVTIKLMCRLCHGFCLSESAEAVDWLVCSVTGCCSWYAVCRGCARASSEAPASSSGADEVCTLVRSPMHVCFDDWSHLICC